MSVPTRTTLELTGLPYQITVVDAWLAFCARKLPASLLFDGTLAVRPSEVEVWYAEGRVVPTDAAATIVAAIADYDEVAEIAFMRGVNARVVSSSTAPLRVVAAPTFSTAFTWQQTRSEMASLSNVRVAAQSFPDGASFDMRVVYVDSPWLLGGITCSNAANTWWDIPISDADDIQYDPDPTRDTIEVQVRAGPGCDAVLVKSVNRVYSR